MTQWQTYIQPPRQGTMHKKLGNSQCQDKAEVKVNDQVIVAVLSDGLGQLEYSGIAASAITLAISTYLVNYDYRQLNEDMLKVDILEECKRAINECSNSLNISVSRMDCTLLFIVLFKNGRKFIYGQLGDGAICFVKPNQGLQAFAFDDGFKASSNLTKTILSSDAIDYFKLSMCSASDLVGFFLTTDGLENELYSKAGKVKKNLEWYFNLISNKDKNVCFNEIHNRWNELTSDEKYGFTDDMSLIAIVQPNMEITLPDEANWLCACGYRNRMESTRCEKCDKDFLKVYKGVNFKQAGGKLPFFTYYNEHPDEEVLILQKHCFYPLEFLTPAHNEVQAGTQSEELPLRELPVQRQNRYSQTQRPSTRNPTELEENTEISRIDANTVAQVQSTDIQTQESLEGNPQGQQYAKAVEAYKRNGRKRKGSGNLNLLACLLLGFVIGLFVHSAFDFVRTDNSKTKTELLSLQRENVNLQRENASIQKENKSLQRENESFQSANDSLTEKIAFLNTKISELEDVQNAIIKLPEGYDYYTLSNGDIYVGQLNQGLPNGPGVVYSSGVLMTGYFQNGLKNGEFYFLYDDGHSEVRTYNKDILIPETESPTNETTAP